MGIPDPHRTFAHRWVLSECEICGLRPGRRDGDCPVVLRQEVERLRAIIAARPATDDLVEALTDARERMMGSSPAIKALIAKTDAALAKAKGAA